MAGRELCKNPGADAAPQGHHGDRGTGREPDRGRQEGRDHAAAGTVHRQARRRLGSARPGQHRRPPVPGSSATARKWPKSPGDGSGSVTRTGRGRGPRLATGPFTADRARWPGNRDPARYGPAALSGNLDGEAGRPPAHQAHTGQEEGMTADKLGQVQTSAGGGTGPSPAAQAVPQVGRYEINTSYSVVAFRTRHLFGLAPVRGSFVIRAGAVNVAESLGDSRIHAEIDAASFRTGNPQRDATVRSARLLDVGRRPVITPRKITSASCAIRSRAWGTVRAPRCPKQLAAMVSIRTLIAIKHAPYKACRATYPENGDLKRF